jgi:hypothetical protein
MDLWSGFTIDNSSGNYCTLHTCFNTNKLIDPDKRYIEGFEVIQQSFGAEEEMVYSVW